MCVAAHCTGAGGPCTLEHGTLGQLRIAARLGHPARRRCPGDLKDQREALARAREKVAKGCRATVDCARVKAAKGDTPTTTTAPRRSSSAAQIGSHIFVPIRGVVPPARPLAGEPVSGRWTACWAGALAFRTQADHQPRLGCERQCCARERPRQQAVSPSMEKDSQHRRLDERLDEALEETFPASDPPAVSLPDEPPRTGARTRKVSPLKRAQGRRARGRSRR